MSAMTREKRTAAVVAAAAAFLLGLTLGFAVDRARSRSVLEETKSRLLWLNWSVSENSAGLERRLLESMVPTNPLHPRILDLANTNHDIIGRWETDPMPSGSDDMLVSKIVSNRYLVTVLYASCQWIDQLTRQAWCSNGLLTLDRPVLSEGSNACRQFLLMTVDGEDLLVPATYAERSELSQGSIPPKLRWNSFHRAERVSP